MFALNGSLDMQVLAESNLNAIYNLQFNHQPSKFNHQNSTINLQNSKFKIYPGLNHLFQHAKTGATTEYANIEETISEEVLSDIAKWINSLE